MIQSGTVAVGLVKVISFKELSRESGISTILFHFHLDFWKGSQAARMIAYGFLAGPGVAGSAENVVARGPSAISRAPPGASAALGSAVGAPGSPVTAALRTLTMLPSPHSLSRGVCISHSVLGKALLDLKVTHWFGLYIPLLILIHYF